jgi:3-keto-5-aminohexanoate cleavage enzyme
MAKIDMSKYKDVPIFGVRLFSEFIIDPTEQAKWEVPDKVAITVAPMGSFFRRQHNPRQPYTPDEFIKEAIECVEAGACTVHVHARDEDGYPSGDRERIKKVVNALRDRFGGNVVIDGEVLFGENFEEMMEPAIEGWYEGAAVNCFAAFIGDTLSYLTPPAGKGTAEVLQAYGLKPLLAVYNPGDVDTTYRWLIKTGIVKPPLLWGIVHGLPGAAPMCDPLSMTETLINTVRRIKDIDKAEYPLIMVTQAGRASVYQITLAMLLGLHVRVGMEDTIYKVPHRDDLVTSNKEEVERIVAIARMLGREPMTAAEYRQAVGMRPFK